MIAGMTLGDVVDRLDGLDDDHTIYDFLEVDIAKEAVRVWSEWRGGITPTLEDKLAAVIHYALNDSFLPVDEGPPADRSRAQAIIGTTTRPVGSDSSAAHDVSCERSRDAGCRSA